MRYVVTVAGRELEVVVDESGMTVDGVRVAAHLEGDHQTAAGTGVGAILTIDGRQHRLVARPGEGRGSYDLQLDGRRLAVEALDERTRAIRAHAKAAAPTGAAPVIAPMPGLIVRVGVAVGDQVEAGQAVLVMEAMKMENELRAPGAGRVKAILVQPGVAVERGAVLVTFEAEG